MKLMVQVKGRKELEAQLKALQGSAMDQALVNALLAGAQPIQDAWQRKVPVRTGSYRRSIHTEVRSARGRSAMVSIGTNLTNPPYPLYLEYGTSAHGPKTKKVMVFNVSSQQVASEIATHRALYTGTKKTGVTTESGMPIFRATGRIVKRQGKTTVFTRWVQGIKARPSARPAFDEKKREALAVIRDTFRRLILKVARQKVAWA